VKSIASVEQFSKDTIKTMHSPFKGGHHAKSKMTETIKTLNERKLDRSRAQH
jgi:hypothetical protein